MKRDIYRQLCEWKNQKNRRPLLIRGARQTGKSFTINEFGEKEFNKLVTLNFERNPEYKDIFNTYDPVDILEKISLYKGERIEPGKTLLFLDEIQECPKAIMSLRYFFEEMPSTHIIAAGSLLEFALRSENFKVPVGRIQYLYLFPLSFSEFLIALGESELRAYLSDFSRLKSLPNNLHTKLNEYIRKYFITGGMPAVVQEYITTHDIINCQRIQRSILDTYVDDFAKYARKSKHQYLKKTFSAVPGMVGQKFVYAQVDRTVKSRDLKEALELLLHAISGIYAETVKEKEFTAIFKGAVAEQFVGQELIAYHDPFTKPALYYWGRKAKNSTAEIDYLLELKAQIVPVEVKSGSVGRMKSLHLFLEKYQSKKAVKISQAPFKAGNPLVSLPFYIIESFLKNSLK